MQKKMYLCILDQAGEIRLHQNIKTDRGQFLNLIKPFRDDIVIAVECMFTWYWIADLCKDHNIPFVPGHALYMKAIHGGKAKNDKIDSHKIAVLLRGGMIPMAYTYPENLRATRDLLRRQNHLKWAFSEAAALFLKANESGKKYLDRLANKHGKGKALSILAHKTGRAVYFMLKNKKPFDQNKFLGL
jgi:hypothetical protein